MFNNPPGSPTQNLHEDPQSFRQSETRVTPESRVRIDSQHLLQGGRELFIAHAGKEYRLRLTRNDKLILTK
ncbi:MAG: hemin uptake protein HemP [Dokdonella sp.]